MATKKATKKLTAKKSLAVTGKLKSIKLAEPRTGTVYTVGIEYRYIGQDDSAWSRETFTILAPNAERALNEAIGVSKYAEPPNLGRTEHRLAEIKELVFVDGITE